VDSGFTWSVIVRVPCGKTISHFVASIEFKAECYGTVKQ